MRQPVPLTDAAPPMTNVPGSRWTHAPGRRRDSAHGWRGGSPEEHPPRPTLLVQLLAVQGPAGLGWAATGRPVLI